MKKTISPYVYVGVSSFDNNDVLPAVCLVTGFDFEHITGKAKKGNINDARTLAVALFLKRGLSLKETGEKMGKRDHSTIIWHRDKFKQLKDNKTDILYIWAIKLKEQYDVDLLS